MTSTTTLIFSTIDTGAWEIYLEHRDIFGNDYHTKYTKAGENFFAGNFKGPRPGLDKIVPSSAGPFGPEDTAPLNEIAP